MRCCPSASTARRGAAGHPPAVRFSGRRRRNRQTGGRNSSLPLRSRSRQSADATTRPSRFLMVERPAQSDCRFSFLLATMKPRPPADASGIFFRVTEFANDTNVSELAAIQLLLEPVLQAG